MSFFPALSLIALLAMLPVLLALRRSAAAGAWEFSAGCMLSAIAIGMMMAADALRMPLAILAGYAALVAAFPCILLGLRRLLALSFPPAVLSAIALVAGIVGLLAALDGPDGLGGRIIVAAGLGAAFLLAICLATLDRWQAEKPALSAAIIGSAALALAALVPVLGPSSHAPVLSGSPAAIAFDLSLAMMRMLFLPSLFFAVILTMQNRIIAGLRAMVARDELTGALSRGKLIEEGERIFADCLARRRPLAFLLLDLDYFKQINDRYGHACGDMALAHFAQTVSAFLDGRGAFGRIGGEEFGLILPNHTEEQAAALADAICRIVRETPAGRAHQRIRLTVSIGIAAAAPGDTITDVMIRADLALYDSKADGRDRCSIARHRQIDASGRALAAAAAQLRHAEVSPHEQLRHTA